MVQSGKAGGSTSLARRSASGERSVDGVWTDPQPFFINSPFFALIVIVMVQKELKDARDTLLRFGDAGSEW